MYSKQEEKKKKMETESESTLTLPALAAQMTTLVHVKGVIPPSFAIARRRPSSTQNQQQQNDDDARRRARSATNDAVNETTPQQPKEQKAVLNYNELPPPAYQAWPIDDIKIVTLHDNFGKRLLVSVPKPFVVEDFEIFSMVVKRLKIFYEEQRPAKMPTPPVIHALLDTRYV